MRENKIVVLSTTGEDGDMLRLLIARELLAREYAQPTAVVLTAARWKKVRNSMMPCDANMLMKEDNLWGIPVEIVEKNGWGDNEVARIRATEGSRVTQWSAIWPS